MVLKDLVSSRETCKGDGRGGDVGRQARSQANNVYIYIYIRFHDSHLLILLVIRARQLSIEWTFPLGRVRPVVATTTAD